MTLKLRRMDKKTLTVEKAERILEKTISEKILESDKIEESFLERIIREVDSDLEGRVKLSERLIELAKSGKKTIVIFPLRGMLFTFFLVQGMLAEMKANRLGHNLKLAAINTNKNTITIRQKELQKYLDKTKITQQNYSDIETQFRKIFEGHENFENYFVIDYFESGTTYNTIITALERIWGKKLPKMYPEDRESIHDKMEDYDKLAPTYINVPGRHPIKIKGMVTPDLIEKGIVRQRNAITDKEKYLYMSPRGQTKQEMTEINKKRIKLQKRFANVGRIIMRLKLQELSTR